MNRIIRYTQPSVSTLFPLASYRRPWAGFESAANQLLETALADIASVAQAQRFPIDLYEDKENTYVRASLPGVNRDEIAIEFVDGNLKITATQKNGEEATSQSRSISVPEAVQADKIGATYENGVLTVTLPKQEQAKPRKIDITVN